jgi:hypothetical protein
VQRIIKWCCTTIKGIFLGDPVEISSGDNGQICPSHINTIPHDNKLRRSSSLVGGILAQIFEKKAIKNI